MKKLLNSILKDLNEYCWCAEKAESEMINYVINKNRKMKNKDAFLSEYVELCKKYGIMIAANAMGEYYVKPIADESGNDLNGQIHEINQFFENNEE